MGEKISYENGDIVDNSVENTGDPLDVSMTGVELDPESQQNYINDLVELGLDMAPGTGEYRSGEAGIEAFKQGDYLGAGLGALGAIPGFGMITRGARRLLPSITKLGPEVSNAMNLLKDREDDLKALMPKSVPNERGLMTDPVEEFAKVNPEKHAELLGVQQRIQDMNMASLNEGTVEGTLRAGGFGSSDSPAIQAMQAQIAGSKFGKDLGNYVSSDHPAIQDMDARIAGSKLGKEMAERLKNTVDDSKFAQGGVVSLVDTARNMTRGPRGIMSFVPYLGAK